MIRILLLISFMYMTMFASSNDIISVNIQANKQASSSSEVNIVLTNNSDKSLKILKWNTPLETTLSANIFDVSVDNKKMRYKGRLVKRGKPTEEDYIIFQAKESKTVSLDLSKYYKMDEKGIYSLIFKGNIKFSIKDSSTQLKSFEENTKIDLKKAKPNSNALEFNFTPLKKNEILAKEVASYNGCSASQITDIDAAHDEAINISSTATSNMNSANTPTSAPRYDLWFGDADITRHDKVKDSFFEIHSALDTKDIVFDCTCDEDYYAHVYPDDPYKIYFCNAFWSAPASKTDSKAGVIVHEISHFTVVAGTDDHIYGKTGAQDLADSNPDEAVENADSYEYFAENTPFITMGEATTYTISGYIKDAATGDGIDGASVTLSGASADSTTTDIKGAYTFYSLDSGDYTVSATATEHTSDSGSTTITTNNSIVNINLLQLTTSVDYKVILSWGASPSDLDSHLFVADPSSEGCLDEVYYSDKTALPYASLDVDDTDSYGPETVTIFELTSGKNDEYWVNHYSSNPNFSISNAVVKVYRGSTLLKTFTVPTNDTTSKYWHVFNIGLNGIEEINTLKSTKEGQCLSNNSSSAILPAILYLLN